MSHCPEREEEKTDASVGEEIPFPIVVQVPFSEKGQGPLPKYVQIKFF